MRCYRGARFILFLIAAYTASAQTSAAPGISSLSPSEAVVGSPAFSLTVSGSNFVSGASVLWNGSPLVTGFTSETQLHAQVPGSLVASAGIASIQVRNAGGVESGPVAFTITGQPLVIMTSTLPGAAVGTAYSATLAATGGAPPYTWSAVDALPAGLTLGPSGVLNGIPIDIESLSFTVRVTDKNQASATKTFALAVAHLGGMTITTPSILPDGHATARYSQTFAAAGGTLPYRWSVTGGTLPPDFTLDPATGVLSGLAGAMGNFSFTVTATDGAGITATKVMTLRIKAPPLTITTEAPLFSGTAGISYSQQFAVAGGVAPYRWSITAGAITGLTINESTGALAGTPESAGSYNLTIQITDSSGEKGVKTFVLVVNAPALTITTGSPLPTGFVGTRYSQTFSVTGGKAPYAWSMVSGEVPGLKLDGATGVLSDAPSQAGNFTITVVVTDSAGLTGRKTFTVTVSPAQLSITTSTELPGSAIGAPYSQSITASGGLPPYRWEANGLPEGLVLDPASGALSGKPAAPGSFVFTVRVTDAAQAAATNLFRVTFNASALPSITITELPATAEPAGQYPFRLEMASPYVVPLSGQILLAFVPDVGGGDSTIQFSNGGRSVSFRIPEGSTKAVFDGPEPAIQSGTVAGSIVLSVRLQASGVDITPGSAPSFTMRLERSAPMVINAAVVRKAGGFDIRITGFSTSREVAEIVFRFAATQGNTLQSSEIRVPTEALFSGWFQDPANTRYGSQFILTQPFTIQGDPNAVNPVSVTVTNRFGSATADVKP